MPRAAFRDIFRLAWPVYVAQMAVMANGVIDTVMAGRYGTTDLAAVGIGAAVYATLFITLMGVLFALTPIVAQAYGARRYGEIGEDVRQSAWLALGVSALSIALLANPGWLLRIAGAPSAVEAITRGYLNAIAWGVPAALLFRVFASFSTAVSRPRAVMVLNLLGLTLKIPLNWALMHGKLGLPALGGAGCGVATALIAWITCGAAWIWCARDADYRRYRIFVHWSWPRARSQWQLVALGVPIGATFFVDVTAFTFMALFIARFGALYSGAHQIVANLAALTFMLPLAIGNATSVLVGQALGASRPDQARTAALAGLALGVGFGLVVGVALFVAAGPLAGLYTADSGVRPIAAGLLGLVAIYHVFDAAQAVASNALRGYKRTGVPMLIYAAGLWGAGLGGGYILGIAGLDVAGVRVAPMAATGFWLAAVGGMALTAALVTGYLLRVSRPPRRADGVFAD